MNDAIVHFVLGSTPIFTTIPLIVLYHGYTKLTDEEKLESKISFGSVAILFPILFGFLFALIYYMTSSIIPRKVRDTIYLRYVLSGSIAALCLSLIAHHIFNIYEDWLEIENPLGWHASIFVLYLILFFSLGQWVRQQVLYGPTPTASVSMPVFSSVETPSQSKFDALAALKKNK